jgi:enterochelin esterase family protein
VHADRTVTFRIAAPTAQAVALAPGPLTMALGLGYDPVPFEQGADSVWTLTAGPVAPNLYVYRLLIDGAAVADPNNTLAGVADQPPYSELVIPGDGPAYYDARPVPHGAVTRHVYHSDVTNGERELFVYTPPGYDPEDSYPVLYLMGGSGELASNWALEGRANFIMDNLLADGAAVPMLIAMPNNQVLHRSHPDHEKHTFDLLEAELRGHVVPFVDAHYSTRPEPAGRALAGLSMGGRHTQFVGFRCLDLFGSFGVLSAGHPDTETLSADFLNDPAVNEKVDYLFVGLGGAEAQPGSPMGVRSEALRAALDAHGIAHEYYVGGDGGHDWGTWRHLLYARFLPGLWRNE